jgi:hypothetical protein
MLLLFLKSDWMFVDPKNDLLNLAQAADIKPVNNT